MRGLHRDNRLVRHVAQGGFTWNENLHKHKRVEKRTDKNMKKMGEKTLEGCTNDRLKKWMEKSEKDGRDLREVSGLLNKRGHKPFKTWSCEDVQMPKTYIDEGGRFEFH